MYLLYKAGDIFFFKFSKYSFVDTPAASFFSSGVVAILQAADVLNVLLINSSVKMVESAGDSFNSSLNFATYSLACLITQLGVSVGVGVDVSVFVGVCVIVFVGVLVGVSVFVGVFVGVSVTVGVGVLVGVSVTVGVGVSVNVGVLVGVTVGVTVFVGVTLGVGGVTLNLDNKAL